jgi:hypothetical protein
LNQLLVNALVFFRRKNVRPNREVVVIAVNQLEWEHGQTE